MKLNLCDISYSKETDMYSISYVFNFNKGLFKLFFVRYKSNIDKKEDYVEYFFDIKVEGSNIAINSDANILPTDRGNAVHKLYDMFIDIGFDNDDCDYDIIECISKWICDVLADDFNSLLHIVTENEEDN